MRRVLAGILSFVMLLAIALVPVTGVAEEKLEYVKLKMLNYGDKPDTGNYDQVWAELNKMLLEKLNCEIEVEWLTAADGSNKMSLILAGNEYFDMTYTAKWFGYSENSSKNGFHPISEEELAAYAPNVYANTDPIVWDQVRINGNIYMIPGLDVGIRQFVALCIRGDLREKYGLEPIDSVEDLVKYMDTIAENERGIEATRGVGMLREMLNYTPNGLCFSYNSAKNFAFYRIDDPDLKLFNIYKADETIAYFRMVREAYEKGWWAADAIANANGDGVSDFVAGVTAVALQNVSTMNSAAKQVANEHPEWKPEVYYVNWDKPLVLDSYGGNGTAISRNSNYPERCLMVMDYILTNEDANNLIMYGIKGVNWDLDENGRRYNLNGDYVPGCNWNWTNVDYKISAADDWANVPEIEKNAYSNAKSLPIAMFNFDDSALTTEIAICQAILEEYKPGLNYGMYEDPEATLKEMCEKLDAAGAEQIIAEQQRQLDIILGK